MLNKTGFLAIMVIADLTTMIDNNRLDGTNSSLNMADNSHRYGDEAVSGKLPNLAAIKAESQSRVREIEEEIEKLHKMHDEAFQRMGMGPFSTLTEDGIEADSRSVYVGNVDYGATNEDLKQHFYGCGYIKRITILRNKLDGHPKGFAYIEFADKDSVQAAVTMDESLFKGRQVKVMPKRTNKPGLATTNRPPRAMLGSFRGGFSSYRLVRNSRGYSRDINYSPYSRRDHAVFLIRT